MMGLVRAGKVTPDEAQALALLSIAASLMPITEAGGYIDLLALKLDDITKKLEIIAAEIGRA